MKDARLGDFLLWKGEPAKVVAETESRQVVIEILEPCKCPHCEGDLGKYQFTVIVSSPLFQDSAEPLQTIVSDPTLILNA